MVIELSRALVTAGHVGELITLIERISNSADGSLPVSVLIESGAISEINLRSIIPKGIRYSWIEEVEGVLFIRDDPRDPEDRLVTKRRMLMHMIVVENPKWIRFLRMGPTDAFVSKLTSNERQLFREFDLLAQEDVLRDANAEKWWYEAQNLGWEIENMIRSEHGKIGEGLSMDLEETRTGLRPIWVSRKDSGAGFDIQSIQAHDDPRQKLIEVKATTGGSVYVTRNEAKICDENRDSYCFHIWRLNRDERMKSLLCTLNAEEVLQHIPENRGSGSWVDVEIPIRAFPQERFECPFLDRA